MKSFDHPVKPEDRDPSLVFIGLPVTGDPLESTTRIVHALENQRHAGAGHLRFTSAKAGGQGVAKARNILIHMARCSGASQLLMIDGDVSFTPEHVFRICALKEDFVGALYPKKQTPLCWVGEFYEGDKEKPHPAGLWPAMSVGSGFLRVSLAAVDQMIDRFPETAYESEEDAPAIGLKPGQIVHDLCSMGVVTDDWFGRTYPRYVTEDYYLSWRHRKAGGRCWVDTNCQVGHVGRIDYLQLSKLLTDAEERGRKSAGT